MTDLLVNILGAFADIGRQLGFVGTILALLVLLAMGAVMRFVERVLKVWDRLERSWRRLPTPARHFTLAAAGLFLAVYLGPSIPWTPALTAMVVFLGAAWWTQGLQFARRYQVRSGPWAAWRYHLEAKSDGIKMVEATEASTAKKGARARKVETIANGKAALMEPPDGLSVSEYATQVNEGKHTAALKRRFGWNNLKGVSAIPLEDGSVLIRLSTEDARPDPLWQERTWEPAS